jgi:MFS transporter, UMF1 family
MTRTERSWILYDVANSAFVLIAITAVGPIFFKDVVSQGVDSSLSTSNWGYANSLASLLLALMAPIMGALADYRGLKKRFFIVFLCVGIGFTFLMAMVREGNWLWFLAAFVIARFGYAGANVFYDSFLVDVTEKDRMDWVSSSGYAWGYIGSVVPFLAALALIFWEMSPTAGESIPSFSGRMAFIIAAVWWLILSIPILRHVRQSHYLEPGRNPIRDSFVRLAKTFREVRKFKQAFLFLAAYFFYIDGVDTIITMCTAYGRDSGLGTTVLILAILMIQILAFPFALIYGKLAGRFSAHTMIFIGIGVYAAITLASFYLPDVSTQEMKTLMFFTLAFFAATSLGGIQALSRSLFAGLIPAERSAEFFGFYNVFGKFATVMGPFLMATASRITGHSRYGVLSVLLLFIVGSVLLYRVVKDTTTPFGAGPR